MIRLATEKDISQIRQLMQSVPGFWHNEWRQDVLERSLAAAGDLAFVYEEAGEIVGFVCAHDVGFLGYLSALVVSDKARGQGVGQQLVLRVEQVLATRGCAVVIADVWKDAVGFYQRLGWSPPDVVLMRKRLLDGVERMPAA
jgi:ribosomal protein S18 acetylase RimI-like enzyme